MRKKKGENDGGRVLRRRVFGGWGESERKGRIGKRECVQRGRRKGE